jgi:hypothetical protein
MTSSRRRNRARTARFFRSIGTSALVSSSYEVHPPSLRNSIDGIIDLAQSNVRCLPNCTARRSRKSTLLSHSLLLSLSLSLSPSKFPIDAHPSYDSAASSLRTSRPSSFFSGTHSLSGSIRPFSFSTELGSPVRSETDRKSRFTAGLRESGIFRFVST